MLEGVGNLEVISTTSQIVIMGFIVARAFFRRETLVKGKPAQDLIEKEASPLIWMMGS